MGKEIEPGEFYPVQDLHESYRHYCNYELHLPKEKVKPTQPFSITLANMVRRAKHVGKHRDGRLRGYVFEQEFFDAAC